MKKHFAKLRKKVNGRMFDGASALAVIGMSGGLKFALIVAIMVLVYFALKKIQEIKNAKEQIAEVQTANEEGLDDEETGNAEKEN